VAVRSSIPGAYSSAGAEKIMALDALEDLDDVQNVYTNVDIPDEVLAAL